MRTLSASTLTTDPYRAGVTLGEALASITPEVVFLFGSVHYFESNELLDGLYDALGRDDLVLIGNSGDGFYEAQLVSDYGVAALAINSGGAVRWRVVSASGVAADPAGTARACLKSLDTALEGEKPAFIFMVADFHADGSRLLEVIQGETEVPVVGGFAADDNRLSSCFLCANRELIRDGLVMLGASGPISFEMAVGTSLTPVGRPGRVDEAEGTTLYAIDGTSAMAFIERETGKPILPTDRGFVTLAVIDPDHPTWRVLRSIVPDFSAKRTLSLFAGIGVGKRVQVCIADRKVLLDDVHAIVDKGHDLPFEPVAALIVSCAWRKSILGGDVAQESMALSRAYPGMAVAGFSSFGEIGPFKEGDRYTRSLYQNMTYVLLLIGPAK
jgi:hypothetical protein